jgi:hypothetical protein
MSTTPEYSDFTEEELVHLKNEVLCCLLAWHNVPSEEVADALIGHLYEKFAVRFGIDPLEGARK